MRVTPYGVEDGYLSRVTPYGVEDGYLSRVTPYGVGDGYLSRVTPYGVGVVTWVLELLPAISQRLGDDESPERWPLSSWRKAGSGNTAWWTRDEEYERGVHGGGDGAGSAGKRIETFRMRGCGLGSCERRALRELATVATVACEAVVCRPVVCDLLVCDGTT